MILRHLRSVKRKLTIAANFGSFPKLRPVRRENLSTLHAEKMEGHTLHFLFIYRSPQ